MEELKAEIKRLQAAREGMEAEIQESTAILDRPNMPGLTAPLTDAEGFPRADVDVMLVRQHRQKVIRLTNDHKEVSTQLLQLLQKLHEAARQPGGGEPSSTAQQPAPRANGVATGGEATGGEATGNGAAAAASPAPPTHLRPFAVVQEVAAGSPAAHADMQVGDQVCRIHDVAAGPGDVLARVNQALQSHEGAEVEAVVIRRGLHTSLRLVPKQWEGRGLLGCHLRPLN